MNTKTIPPCQAACPIGTDVRGYVSAIARGDVEEAIRIIRQVNPLPSVCGRICTRLCEKACRRSQVDKPVAIRALKRYAADETRHLSFMERPRDEYKEKIAVIGGGPAGLTAAHDLALLGYKVTIFDAQKLLGGLLSEGIPEYRLPKELVGKEIEDILSLGIESKTGMCLGRDFTIEGLLSEYQAVFLAIGSQKSVFPRCKGNDLSGVISGFDFLKKAGRGRVPPPGKRVLVIGGGHTAIDAARTCIRLGCRDVTIVYRRTLDEMPAGREEVEDAEKEGVKMMYLTSPVEFLGEGKIRGVKFVRMRLGEPDASGRRRPVPMEHSEFELEADAVLLAIGYVPDSDSLIHNGLQIDRKGTVIVQGETGVTNIEGVFAAGDVVTGPKSVIEAMASGRRAAEAIHRYFRKEAERGRDAFVPFGPLDSRVAEMISKIERREMPVLDVDERVDNFEEVDRGYSRDDAVSEALRCLNCGAGASVDERCAACLNCVRVCPFGIPVLGGEFAEIDLSQCQACGICAAECPACAIDIKSGGVEDLRREVDRVVDFARQEAPDMLILGFYCRYDSPLGPPLETESVYWIGRCCTGSLRESQLLYPFELGAEGVVATACRGGQCRFRHGDKWLAEHIKRARNVLRETGIGEERLSFVSGEEDFVQFRQGLDVLGINPLREGKKVGS